MKRTFSILCLSLPLAAPAAGDAARLAFERFADVAVSLPPEIRTQGLAAYSTNRLDFALNNGLAMTAGGRIWASWISGGDGTESFTAAAWSDDGGETWTDTKLVIDGHDGTIAGRTNIIGTFWLDPDGRFHLFTDQSLLHFDGRAGVWESVCENPDDAHPVWSKPRRIGDGHLINKPIVLPDGSWAMSVYLNGTWKSPKSFLGAFPQLDAERGAICYVSTDRGASWEKRGVVRFPSEDRTKTEGCRVEDWQESQLLPCGDVLRVFARVIDGKEGHVMTAESRDAGRTWGVACRMPTMDGPNSRFQVLRLKSGRMLYVTHGDPAKGAPAWRGRDFLTAYLSEDDGRTWRGGLLLDAGPCSYPDAFQSPSGDIYVSNDHNRSGDAEIRIHRFREEDVLAGRVVTPTSWTGRVAIRAMASGFNRRRAEEEAGRDARALLKAAGTVTAKTPGWRFEPSRAQGGMSFNAFEGHYPDKGGKLVAPRVAVKGGSYYRLTFGARTAVEGFEAVNFYDRNGDWIADNYDVIYPGVLDRYDRVFLAPPGTAEIEVFFQSKSRCDVRDVRVCEASVREAAEFCDRTAAKLPALTFAPKGNALDKAPKTLEALRTGRSWRILLLGDSIMQDTYHSQFQSLVQRLFPKAQVTWLVSVRGSTGCWYYAEPANFETSVAKYRPDCVFIGGISGWLKKGHPLTGVPAIEAVADRVTRELGSEVVILTPTLASDLRQPSGTAAGTACPRTRFDPSALPTDPKGAYDVAAAEELRRLCDRRGWPLWDLYTPAYGWLFGSGAPFRFYSRDAVHSGELGKQLIGRLLERYFKTAR